MRIRPGIGLTLIVTSACVMVGRGARVPDLAGEWVGSVDMDGQRLDATLRLGQMGDSLEVTLTAAEVGTYARGGGSLSGRRVSMTVFYQVQCEGTAVMVGALGDDGMLAGNIQATDCTGNATGSFTFRRPGG